MEEKNRAIINESMTFHELSEDIGSLAYRLTPDQTTANEATIRSLNTLADAVAAELNNLRRLLETYAQ